MIKKLSVKNFKSIKELEVDCKRVNLFIGEPNTGKSNILEALGLLSWCGHGNEAIKEYIRLEGIHNLFHDNNLTSEKIEVRISKTAEVAETAIRIEFKNEEFQFDMFLNNSRSQGPRLDYSGAGSAPGFTQFRFIKYYIFERQTNFQGKELSFLMPPHGSNMLAVVMTKRKTRVSMARFFKNYNLQLVLRSHANAFEFQKYVEEEDIDSVFTYPYILASDTLQRIIFYTVAIESNEDSTLVFEEPESHAFPYYTKYLGEKIAFDESNQYFIATHNPYLLLSILEKTPRDSVNVFITYSRDYQTKVKCLNDDEISELMRYEPFFNLDSFIEDEEEDTEAEDEGEEQ